jgi:hypothetical protein
LSASSYDEELPASIVTILGGAEQILISKGFERYEVRAALERRLARCADLSELQKACKRLG